MRLRININFFLIKLPVIILVIVSPLFSFIQDDNIETKEWSKENRLTWADFKGKPDLNSKRAAISDCRITSAMKGKKDSILFTVESFINLNGSWVKENQKNDLILKHEQGHFDINEIFARKFRKALKEKKVNKGTINSEFRGMQSEYFNLLNKEQALYDSETDHSTNTEKQLEWDKKISSELKELEQYGSATITVAYSKQ